MKILDLTTVCECNRCLGREILHPQVSVVNLERPGLAQDIKFEFYAVLLIEECPDGCCCCGRKYYDYSNATMVFLTPGEVFRMGGNDMLPGKGWLLAFHPDLLLRASLKNHIGHYTFFAYGKEEALHLSQRETAKATRCLENIEEELHHAVDTHTATILSRHIELLLDYCARFYERQFITREDKNRTVMERLEKLLDDCIASGKLRNGPLSVAEYCAGELGLSSAYFADLLKFKMGKTPDEFFETKRMAAARRRLLHSRVPVGRIAEELGYPSLQFFCTLFRKMNGLAPGDYRLMS